MDKQKKTNFEHFIISCLLANLEFRFITQNNPPDTNFVWGKRSLKSNIIENLE